MEEAEVGKNMFQEFLSRIPGFCRGIVLRIMIGILIFVVASIYFGVKYWMDVKKIDSWPKETPKDTVSIYSPEQAKELVGDLAGKVIVVIKNKDANALAGYASPLKGVRFSPYSFINTDWDKIFSAQEIKTFFINTEIYAWGAYDGSGQIIDFTPSQYYDRFIYDKDFANAPEIGYNQELGRGNAPSNIFEEYTKNTIFVEYYFEGTEVERGMDWKSLRLVFQKENEQWYLVGIVHAEWTI